MDFANAALLIAVLLGLVQLAKVAWKGTNEQRITVGIVVVMSLVAVFLLATSVWAKEQVIGGHALDQLDVGSKLVVALFLAGGASALWEGFTTVKNVGVPARSKVEQAAIDAGSQAFVGQHPSGVAPEAPAVAPDVPPSTMPPA